ncbi:uncharacterized protein TRIVIDRAFT_48046 [Trichoderma virens Gv29-8]|uniref:C2H2-type domain-containing protein n=1 Tax=Hypocrea virens (strain Gv29-8 / FGSC 10586) TaxID=413071 RepID=G9MZQ1_HYPVG|nr:uncharacterized protein TRIVIDRAFT_48046 [Trichoderma virens Gv29-8]EHK20107.1 hypothetical protein TRIVIDRAFT_48046 [Trichoderma virens Gv29-8]
MGHGSLDYRIRDSESMKEAILKMMKNLNRSLDEVLAYLHGNIEQEDEDSDADSDSEMESDMDLLLDSIKDPVDRLYKMAVWIRNPSTRIASSKARNFQQIDEKTNIDLFKSYETFDYDYVSSLFLEYEKNKALQENPTAQHHDATGDNEEPAVGDQVWEPIRQTLELNRIKISNGNESYLVHRIAQANGLRRRQFAYWRKHKGKLREHTAVTVELLSHKLPTGDNIIQDESKRHKAPLTVTTATQLHPSHGAGKELLENENIMPLAVSEYAPSAWNPSKDIVSFPLPPKVSTTDEFFECPYCYTICPASILSEKAWRAHLIRDLRPYICTFEHCSNSEQLYDSRDDWIQHETSAHQTVFRCPKHEETTFTTLSTYEEHTQEYHKEDSMSLNFAKSTITNNQRSCPVCSIVLGSMQKLQSHIALHLERFAMFAIPRCTDNGDREDSGGRSASAHVDSNKSLDGDLDAESNATGKTGDENFINHEILTKIRDMSNEIATLRSPVHMLSLEETDFFLEQMKKICFQLKKYGKIIRAWPPSNTTNTALFELGEACIAAGLIDEAIETLEHLKFFQISQLDHDDPALLQTKQQLTIAYQVHEALQEVTKRLNANADLHTEPSKSKALDIFARTEAGARHAETIWGPTIWKDLQKRNEHDRENEQRLEQSFDYFSRSPVYVDDPLSPPGPREIIRRRKERLVQQETERRNIQTKRDRELEHNRDSPQQRPVLPYDERLVWEENNPDISHVGQDPDNADDSTQFIQESILSKDYEKLRDINENSRNIQPGTYIHLVAALEQSVKRLDPRRFL